MRSRSEIVIAVLGLAVLVTCAFGAGRAQASRETPAPAAPPPSAPAPVTQAPAPPLHVESAPAAPPPSAPAAPAAPEHDSVLADAPPEAIPALVASSFESEPVDRSWATTTSDEMRNGARAITLPGVDVRDVSCRSTICRVDVRMPKDGPPPRAFFDAMCIGPDAKWAKLHVGCYLAPPETRSGGEQDVVLYAFRDGRLP